MALTKDLIIADAGLKTLTAEQIAAIITLSTNDEKGVIEKKVGEATSAFEADILTSSGLKKEANETSSVYLKRVLQDYKDKAKGDATLQAKVNELTAEKERLEKVIKEGGNDTETKRLYDQSVKDLENVRKQFNTLKKDFDKSNADHAAEIFGMQMDNEIKVAMKGVKFKSNIPESATAILAKQVADKVKAMNPSFIDDGNGGKRLVYKDEKGAILRNPEAQLNPYSTTDLIMKEFKTMDILEPGRSGGGAGGSGGSGGQQTTPIDFSGVKNRVEANDLATKILMEKGFAQGTEEFDTEMSKIWDENKIGDMPIR